MATVKKGAARARAEAAANRKEATKPKEKAKPKAREKTEAQIAKEEERAAKKAAREEAAAEKERLREEAIENGDILIIGDYEYRLLDPDEKKKATVDERTAAIISDLEESTVPLTGKALHEKHGGSWALMIPVFSSLKALGLVKEYRFSSGQRGGSGVAYLHKNHWK